MTKQEPFYMTTGPMAAQETEWIHLLLVIRVTNLEQAGLFPA